MILQDTDLGQHFLLATVKESTRANCISAEPSSQIPSRLKINIQACRNSNTHTQQHCSDQPARYTQNPTIRQEARLTTTTDTSNLIIVLHIHQYLGESDVNRPLLRAHTRLSNFAAATGRHPRCGLEKAEREARRSPGKAPAGSG